MSLIENCHGLLGRTWPAFCAGLSHNVRKKCEAAFRVGEYYDDDQPPGFVSVDDDDADSDDDADLTSNQSKSAAGPTTDPLSEQV